MSFKDLTFAIFFAVTLTSPSAFAVRIANCPPSIKVSYSEIRVSRTLEQVYKYLGTADFATEEIEAVKTAHEKVSKITGVKRAFPLVRAKSGHCFYHAGTMEKIEIYSEAGKDKLLVQTELGPRGILLRLYAQIQTLTTGEIALINGKPAITLAVPRYPYTNFTAGGSVVFVGNASAITTTAGK